VFSLNVFADEMVFETVLGFGGFGCHHCRHLLCAVGTLDVVVAAAADVVVVCGVEG